MSASVSYTLSTDTTTNTAKKAYRALCRAMRALEALYRAVSYLQEAGLLYQSFTVICCGNKPPQTMEMHRIGVDNVISFMKLLRRLSQTSSGHYPDLSEVELQARKILQPTGLFASPQEPILSATPVRAFNMCSLVVQFLCLGFLLYSQAHSGNLQPFFLDRPINWITLLGNATDLGPCHIDVRLQELTCMGDMIQDKVIVFRGVQTISEESQAIKYDLLASPEDIIDTWGPGKFYTTHRENGDRHVLAIGIGGGTISLHDTKSDIYHWSRGPVQPLFLGSFDPRSKISIGTSIKVNDRCAVDPTQRWTVCTGFQGGQFVNVQYNQTGKKTPGITLKQLQIDLPDDHLLPFLQSNWRLQVSICTSVARRVPLRELLADVMPAFVESRFPIPKLWEALKTTHGILDAFRNSNLQGWLGKLDSEQQQLVAQIIRDILLVLQHIGIDQKGGHFIIAWSQKENPFQCFKVPCEKESYWARILADSGDCATFAYITTKCLETEWLKCQGAQATWHNTCALLETAVCRHKPDDTQVNAAGAVTPLILKHADVYLMRKPESLLRVVVERPVGSEEPKLHVAWSMIPRAMRFRLDVRKMPKRVQRLRERQAIDAPAEMVVILAGKPS